MASNSLKIPLKNATVVIPEDKSEKKTSTINWDDDLHKQKHAFSKQSPKEKGKVSVPLLHHLALIVLSSLMTASSLVPLFLQGLASDWQSYQFYLGWAVTKGQLPYNDIFSRSGILYNGLMTLVNYLDSDRLVLPFFLVGFYVSGLYLHKLTNYLTQDNKLSLGIASLFYFFNLTFGFGGFYPIQLAMPFLIYGLWLLVTYLDDWRRDEIFIPYGVISALSFSLDPRTLLFWCLAFAVLTISNITKGRWLRGFYQNLNILFGCMLIIIPLGFVGISLELVNAYIWQAFGESFLSLVTLNSDHLVIIWVSALALVFSGLLTGLVQLPKTLGKMAEQRSAVVLLGLSTFVYALVALLSQNLASYELLPVLPFGLLLTACAISDGSGYQAPSRSRRRQVSSAGSQKGYLRAHLFLPLFISLASVAWFVYPALTQEEVSIERQQIGQYLTTTTSATDPIYAWDNSAEIYLISQRPSVSQLPVATVYTTNPSTKQLLVDQLLQDKARYIVVNKSLPLPKQVKDKLASHYEQLTFDQLQYFEIYEQQ